MRCYQYLQAPVQEHIATLSGAELLVGEDLVRPQQTTVRPQSDDTPETPSGDNAMTASNVIERLRYMPSSNTVR